MSTNGALSAFRRLERMTAFHPLLKFKLGHYQIVTRRFAEFSSQKAAREAHQNEQALARTRLRLSRRPIFDASGKPHFWD
jgi:hypothetical protein